MRLENKVAIVTGAAAGFGEGIARRFADEGATVVVSDIDDATGEAVVAGIRAAGGKADYHHADVVKSDQVRDLVAAAVDAHGGLDIIVNNAGVPQRNGPMLGVDEATFDRIFEVNVKSVYLAAVHGVPAFRARGGGVFVNTASTAALRPRPGLTWYNASKGAVTTMTKSMAVELAPENIRVNAICPVASPTGMLVEFMGGEYTEEKHKMFMDSVPLGRLSTPLDIANAALYLASDEANFITGVCLEVDGGRCI